MASYYGENGGASSSSSPAAPPPLPLHLLFFLLTLLLFLGLSWYLRCEAALDGVMGQLRLLLLASPLALLLAVSWLSSGGEGRRGAPLLWVLPGEREALHRAGGSPAGVGLLLALLLLMVSYQPYFRRRWFPLI